MAEYNKAPHMMGQTNKQSPAARMNAISEQGLCAGCGLCQSIAGKDKIQFTKVANGYEDNNRDYFNNRDRSI